MAAGHPAEVGGPPALARAAPLAGVAALLAAAGAADYWLAGRGFTLPLVYLLPVAAAIWRLPWRLILATGLIAALINFGVDAALAGRIPEAALVSFGNTAFFGVVLLLSRGAYIGRMMLDYYQRGAAWRLIYKPARIGERFVVVPTWLAPTYAGDPGAPQAEFVLVMDPGKAFGTGSHPTTQMCVALIEQTIRPGDRVLDLGCGSGILSIAAARLGAGHVLGLDIDPEAVRVTAANAASNEAAQVEARLGSLDAIMPRGGGDSPPQFELVVANILTDFILAAMDFGLARTVAPGGHLILSGIRVEEAARVEAAVLAAGLELAEHRDETKWSAIMA
ncbi:MAG: 50S ribosomal protein L11 methyltransferase, partial [Anaerolineales bacterium]